MHLAVALTTTSPRAPALRTFTTSASCCAFAALVVERRLIKANPDRREATAMVITDIVYGIAALALW